MMARLSVLALLAFLVLPLSARASVFYPESFTLDNGLQIVVVPNHLAPAVTQMVWYKVGSTDEVPGIYGLAHYLEHLMFRGTAAVPPGEFSRIIAAQGGNENAFTSYDYTAFHETVASDRLGMVMQMEADRMQNLQIKPETAVPELSVVLNERQERTDNSPQGAFEEKLNHLFLPNYPYGLPVIGWKPEIEQLNAAKAQAFYRQHYAPNNAIVIISGDTTLDEVKKLAATTYGQVPRRDVAPRAPLPEPAVPAEHRFEVSDLRVEQPHIEMHVAVPSYSTQKNNEAYAYEVLQETLDGGEVGVLYHELTLKQKCANANEVSYDPDTRGVAPFVIALEPAPGIAVGELEKNLKDMLQNLAKDGLPPKAILAAKDRMQRSAIFARDSLAAPGYVFGEGLTTGHSIDDIEAWPDRINAVTPAQVNQALRDLVSNDHYIVGVLLPDANATPEARAKAQDMPHSHEPGIR